MSTHTGPAILVGFGDPADDSTFAYFHVERDDRADAYPDWEADDYLTIRHIPGSDNNDVYDGGAGPQTITLRLRFDDQADYDRFRAFIKTTGTLRLINGFTSLTGTVQHEGPQDYIEYADVFLQRPRAVNHRIGGAVECEVPFLLLGEAS